MNTALWIVQSLLAFLFITAGFMKLTMPIDKLAKITPWASRYPVYTVRMIGTCEILGAAGLILPWLLCIEPILTPAAAGALALLQLLALFHHARHKESKEVALNIVLFGLAVFVSWGRFSELFSDLILF